VRTGEAELHKTCILQQGGGGSASLRPERLVDVTIPNSAPAPSRPAQRLEWLYDAGSLELMAPASPDPLGVVAAHGLVDGRPVVAYAQDATHAGGSVGTREAEMVVRAMRSASRLRVPLVGFLESAGARLQEGAAALGGFGRIFFENVALSGRVPQVSVITGVSAGGGCYSPALTDFVVMVADAAMFLTGPKVVYDALGEAVGATELGGVAVHERNGVCHLVAADDRDAVAQVRRLLDHLPSRAGEALPRRAPVPPDEGDPGAAVPELGRSVYDVRAVIRRLADGGDFIEVMGRWARNLVVGFARLDGAAVGIVANQPRYLGGVLDVDASQKGARFVSTCAGLGVPLVVLVDTPGFMPGIHQEAAGIIRHGAQLLHAFAAAEVPRFTVVLRKAYGGAYITMNSKDLGADVVLAWPGAEIGIMGSRAAVGIIHRRELEGAGADSRLADRLAEAYGARHVGTGPAVRLGLIDAVVEPAATRGALAAALACCGTAARLAGGRRAARVSAE
jgi:acetyl-CoA carboxylase carboxyltransferase component